MEQIEIYSPVAATRLQSYSLAPRLRSINAQRIGFLDNLKANAGTLLQHLTAGMRGRGTDFEIVVTSKNATAAAPASVMAHLKTCDAVVLAIAD
jgi:hypothetical protein